MYSYLWPQKHPPLTHSLSLSLIIHSFTHPGTHSLTHCFSRSHKYNYWLHVCCALYVSQCSAFNSITIFFYVAQSSELSEWVPGWVNEWIISERDSEWVSGGCFWGHKYEYIPFIRNLKHYTITVSVMMIETSSSFLYKIKQHMITSYLCMWQPDIINNRVAST